MWTICSGSAMLLWSCQLSHSPTVLLWIRESRWAWSCDGSDEHPETKEVLLLIHWHCRKSSQVYEMHYTSGWGSLQHYWSVRSEGRNWIIVFKTNKQTKNDIWNILILCFVFFLWHFPCAVLSSAKKIPAIHISNRTVTLPFNILLNLIILYF